MADKYACFKELQAAEAPGTFTIFARESHATFAVMAPHGGRIEPGTSEIARAIAGDDLALYIFDATKDKSNRDLHITSSRFDEPECLHMLRTVRMVLTIHGEESDADTVFVGGRHPDFPGILRAELAPAGFHVEEHENRHLQGRDPLNICNRGVSGRGMQLELSRGLRQTLFKSLKKDGLREHTPRFVHFCRAVRAALLKTPA
ncbi:replication protein [Paraburkholderia sp. UCT31]|uniref:poly-gamma-glutamate hydrolase family protein n=1 Tax=Paraburkholderia sp. UCT31 TaxID=2615209 RepID=UPI0016555FEA|nr:poly-gamma-glutamate hydrolase family protein [Paraburkholderia sp. UCT31]MBC8740620.1 replication protein [Paraburkholderia sp. UCT31]